MRTYTHTPTSGVRNTQVRRVGTHSLIPSPLQGRPLLSLLRRGERCCGVDGEGGDGHTIMVPGSFLEWWLTLPWLEAAALGTFWKGLRGLLFFWLGCPVWITGSLPTPFAAVLFLKLDFAFPSLLAFWVNRGVLKEIVEWEQVWGRGLKGHKQMEQKTRGRKEKKSSGLLPDSQFALGLVLFSPH